MNDQAEEKIESWMFREPHEFLALAISLFLLFGIAYSLSQLNEIYLLIVVGAIIFVWLSQYSYLGSAIRVHKNQFPEIFDIFSKHAERLGINKAALYIEQDPYINAYTLGITNCVVVLTSALVEQFDKEELSFVIGHELGHYKAGHTKISTIFNPPEMPKSLKTITNLIFLFWNRKQEYTGDRCGLILTKNIDSAISALIKLSIGGHLFRQMDIKGYVSQLLTAEKNPVRMSELLLGHPLTTNRIKHLHVFWKESFVVKS